jgi:hypothetical protein
VRVIWATEPHISKATCFVDVAESKILSKPPALAFLRVSVSPW